MDEKEIRQALIKVIKKSDKRRYELCMDDPHWREGEFVHFGISVNISELGIELYDAIVAKGASYAYHGLDFIIDIYNNQCGLGYVVFFDREKLGLKDGRKIKRIHKEI